MSVRRAGAAALASALSLALPACGVPTESRTRVLEREDVPYRLLEPGPEPAGPSAPGPVRRGPQVFLLGQEGLLVPQLQPVVATDPGSAVAEVLAALTAGPTELQRARGLANAFGPGAELRLAGLAAGTATVEVAPGEPEPTADRLPLAVGQVVLSATSVDGVARVRLVQDGAPVEAPLPGGERTSEPVDAEDYRALVAAPAPGGPSPVPS